MQEFYNPLKEIVIGSVFWVRRILEPRNIDGTSDYGETTNKKKLTNQLKWGTDCGWLCGCSYLLNISDHLTKSIWRSFYANVGNCTCTGKWKFQLFFGMANKTQLHTQTHNNCSIGKKRRLQIWITKQIDFFIQTLSEFWYANIRHNNHLPPRIKLK